MEKSSEETLRVVRENWLDAKERIKRVFSSLTEDDLRYRIGEENELLGRLQGVVGKSRDQLLSIIKIAASIAPPHATLASPRESPKTPDTSKTSLRDRRSSRTVDRLVEKGRWAHDHSRK
ncbi:MAG: hypothetical protein HY961_06350 [Ignavibacteriae bacterium]|nr:hypothetical protein [Ignavibacteriota bacterium]